MTTSRVIFMASILMAGTAIAETPAMPEAMAEKTADMAAETEMQKPAMEQAQDMAANGTEKAADMAKGAMESASDMMSGAYESASEMADTAKDSIAEMMDGEDQMMEAGMDQHMHEHAEMMQAAETPSAEIEPAAAAEEGQSWGQWFKSLWQ